MENREENMEDPVWRAAWKAGAESQWMAYGSTITQICWCFSIAFVYPILAYTCCKSKPLGQGFNMRMYVGPLFITIIVNTFACIPFFLVCKFIVDKCILKKESSIKPHWFGTYLGNFCWVIFGFIAVAEGWEYAGF